MCVEIGNGEHTTYRNIYWLAATYLIREHIYHIGNEFPCQKDVCALRGLLHFFLRLLPAPALMHEHIAYNRITQHYTLLLKYCGHNDFSFSFEIHTHSQKKKNYSRGIGSPHLQFLR